MNKRRSVYEHQHIRGYPSRTQCAMTKCKQDKFNRIRVILALGGALYITNLKFQYHKLHKFHLKRLRSSTEAKTRVERIKRNYFRSRM